jgi:hypothetical protein
MTGEEFEDIAIEDKIAQLGEPTAEFAVRGLAFFRSLVLAPLLVAGGLILEIILVGVLHIHHYEILLPGIVLIGSGVMLLVRAFRDRGLRVVVFPEGLVRLHRGRALAFWWEEIDRVWQKEGGGSHGIGRVWRTHSLTLQAADGRRMTFDDSLPRLGQLSQIVRRETLPRLLHRVEADYEAGKTLDFGKLRISQRGLSQGKETLPWSELRQAKGDEDHLFIYKKGKWRFSLAFTGSEIPNFHVLLALIEQRIPVERSTK